jgi:hypothetical protein
MYWQLVYLINKELSDNFIVFEDLTTTIVDLMVAN